MPAGSGRSRAAISVDRAIEVFARGHAFRRGFTHPYGVERVDSLLVMRDAPRKNGKYRNEEWLAYNVPPEEVDRIARAETRGRYAVCAFVADGESDEPLRAAYRALGYRLQGTEPLMVHGLDRISSRASPADIERVMTEDLAGALAKAARRRLILREHFAEDAPLRQYVAMLDGDLAGWTTSISVGNATYCSDMFVKPAYRRRGIATALMSRLLRDDRAAGSTTAVLVASHTGALLYPHLGYEQIGTLLLYVLPRS